MTQHYAMLPRNLLHTGVTLGKKLVIWKSSKQPRFQGLLFLIFYGLF